MSQQNIDLVQSAYAAFGRGDVPGLLALLDQNVEWQTPGPSDLPTAGTRRGHAQVAEFFGTLGQIVDIEHFEPHTFIADGERVVVLGRETYKVRATGNRLNSEWCHVFTIRNSRVVAFQEYIDASAIVADLKTAVAPA